MTLDQLIELLEDAREEVGGEAAIMCAFQPSYPLRADLRGIVTPSDLDYEEVEPDLSGPADRIWLVLSGGVDYDVPRILWDIARR